MYVCIACYQVFGIKQGMLSFLTSSGIRSYVETFGTVKNTSHFKESYVAIWLYGAMSPAVSMSPPHPLLCFKLQMHDRFHGGRHNKALGNGSKTLEFCLLNNA